MRNIVLKITRLNLRPLAPYWIFIVLFQEVITHDYHKML